MSNLASAKPFVNTRAFVAYAPGNAEVEVEPGVILVPDCVTLIYQEARTGSSWMLTTYFSVVTTDGLIRLWTHGRLAERQVAS